MVRRKKAGQENKFMVEFLDFIYWLLLFGPLKNSLTEEVYLAVMLSKILLDLEMQRLLCLFITIIIILHSRPASV